MTNFVNYLVDTLHPKRRTVSSKAWEVELEQEGHSLLLSQHSSPSQSNQEQTPLKKSADSISGSDILHSMLTQIFYNLYANSLLFHDLCPPLCSNILHFFTKIRSKRLLKPFSMGQSLYSRRTHRRSSVVLQSRSDPLTPCLFPKKAK